jgi:hypothetical protein
MAFLDILQKLPKYATRTPSRAGITFEHGCPRCAIEAIRQVNQNGRDPSVDQAGTRAVIGITPFSYLCGKCYAQWQISSPHGHARGASFAWFAVYLDGTSHLYTVDNCPDCGAAMSRYRGHRSIDPEQDNTWCMTCGAKNGSE